MIAFGPVPSRRLGRSVGINNIPPKHCSYSCVYCQLMRTRQMEITPRFFYSIEKILDALSQKIQETQQAGQAIDYLTFVPDGEPTLDIHLGQAIHALKPLGIPIAVITNASLLWQEDVRWALLQADWVSLKVDAVSLNTWRRINRPHRALQLERILSSVIEFARLYQGKLATETMLVKGINDQNQTLQAIASFLKQLHPNKAYLSIPTRPPAERWVQPPDATTLTHAYHLVAEQVPAVEYLTGYEGNAFALTGNVVEDILSITAVHPMREDAIYTLLERANAPQGILKDLIAAKKLLKIEYGGNTFYLRNFK